MPSTGLQINQINLCRCIRIKIYQQVEELSNFKRISGPSSERVSCLGNKRRRKNVDQGYTRLFVFT